MNAINALAQAKQMEMLARPVSWRSHQCGIAWTGRTNDVVGWTIEPDASNPNARISITAILPPLDELLEEWEVVPRPPGTSV